MKIATFQQGGNYKVDAQSGLMHFAGRASVPANNAVHFGKAGIALHANNASRAMFDMAYPSAARTNSNRLNFLA